MHIESTESTKPPLIHRRRKSRCRPVGVVHKIRRSGAKGLKKGQVACSNEQKTSQRTNSLTHSEF